MEISLGLLYPQTFLFPTIAQKIFSLFSKILILKTPVTLEILDNTLKDTFPFWKEKIEFVFPNLGQKIDVEILKKEIQILEEWGLNFRTPENLKYFMQFKQTLEESLSGIFPKPESQNKKENFKEWIEIKRALVILILAEKLDFSLYEIEKSLEILDRKYLEFFEKEILKKEIDFKILPEIRYIENIYFPSYILYHLKHRVSAWKVLFPYLNLPKNLNTLIITEESLIDKWEEKYKILKTEKIKENIKFYQISEPLSVLLEANNRDYNFERNSYIVLIKY